MLQSRGWLLIIRRSRSKASRCGHTVGDLNFQHNVLQSSANLAPNHHGRGASTQRGTVRRAVDRRAAVQESAEETGEKSGFASCHLTQARFQEQKLEKRVQEKARRRERTKALKEGYAAGTLTEEEKTVLETRRELQRARKAAGKGKEGDVFPGSLVIDLAFDDLMTDGEITSMAGQLAYVYSVNRTAKRPFAGVLFTSFGPEASPRLWTKLRKNNWDKWSRSHFWEEGVDGLAAVLKGEAVAPFTRGEEEDELVASLSGPTLPSTLPPDSQLVYLSADAEEELATLSPNETYVIGGIVDRNRHKMLCQNKAEGLGIRTARLPIGTFIENMPTRKVLTVNQVGGRRLV